MLELELLRVGRLKPFQDKVALCKISSLNIVLTMLHYRTLSSFWEPGLCLCDLQAHLSKACLVCLSVAHCRADRKSNFLGVTATPWFMQTCFQ
jgi:hypothetical protein